MNVVVVAAGGEGHHDGGDVSGACEGPAQGEGGALGARVALREEQRHRPLPDLLTWGAQSVRLQGRYSHTQRAFSLLSTGLDSGVDVPQLYRSDSDSSTLPKKSPFIRNTLERRTLRYKQVVTRPQRLLLQKILALCHNVPHQLCFNYISLLYDLITLMYNPEMLCSRSLLRPEATAARS